MGDSGLEPTKSQCQVFRPCFTFGFSIGTLFGVKQIFPQDQKPDMNEVGTWKTDFSSQFFFHHSTCCSAWEALNDRLGNAQQPTGLGLLVGGLNFGRNFTMQMGGAPIIHGLKIKG